MPITCLGSSPVSVTTVLESHSFVDQLPSGLGLSNALIVTFDPVTIISDDGCLAVNSDGTIEILKPCTQHTMAISVRLGRSGAGGVAKVVGWMEVALDGITFVHPADSDTVMVEFDNADVAGREVFTVRVDPNLPVGALLRFRFARDESGHNSGGLLVGVPTGTLASLTQVPSADVHITVAEA